ncbi:ubiquitin carboxyl-terminal hydrolase 2-like isoform X4 [Dasypus novemcinctus]|uniref:ubiquitin carboxyl-terminal hydrolase 2-like isoform X4 n=1 Tax=Dasypus novemcinctus TaxID=9361 RepID=UPI00265EF4F5|nr:ubiquitin carboxyl-terminal hydrolase 21-like isoform X5 [Dasypus novemcinctus]
MGRPRGSQDGVAGARPPDAARGSRGSCGARDGHRVAGDVRGARRALDPSARRQDVGARVGQVQAPPPEARRRGPRAERKGGQSRGGGRGAGRVQLPPPPPAPRPGSRGAAGPSLPTPRPSSVATATGSGHESSRRSRSPASVSLGPSWGRPPFVGLVNHGLTCYLNALLQCLFVTPEFRDRVQDAPRSSQQQQALEQIFGDLEARRGPVETRALTACLGLGYGQQDVGEVFLLLLDKLGRDDLQEVFQSEVEKVIRCSRCGSEDHIPPGGRTLLLPLASLVRLHGLDGDGQAPRELPREPAGRAQDTGALSGPHVQHFDEDDNLFFCERCDAKTPASKEQRFLRLPKILVLQVSEFTFKKGKFHKAQATTNVSHVLELQTAPRAPAAPHSSGSRGATVTPAPERKRYHLYAMCSHRGDYSGGHYTALVQPPGQEQWYHFNDQRVDRVGSFPQQFTHRSGLPYLLMYRCQDSRDSPKANPGADPHWAGAPRGPPAGLGQGWDRLEPRLASTAPAPAPAPAQVSTWV